MCIKCVVDSGHSGAMAQMLAHEQAGWENAVNQLYALDAKGEPIYRLTDVEKQAIVDLSQRECDWATEMYQWIQDGNGVLRTIAIAHSFPNKP